jgi:hypothetical protein
MARLKVRGSVAAPVLSPGRPGHLLHPPECELQAVEPQAVKPDPMHSGRRGLRVHPTSVPANHQPVGAHPEPCRLVQVRQRLVSRRSRVQDLWSHPLRGWIARREARPRGLPVVLRFEVRWIDIDLARTLPNPGLTDLGVSFFSRFKQFFSRLVTLGIHEAHRGQARKKR